MPTCTVNGSSRIVDDGATIAALLDKMNLRRRKVAVEQNGVIVPKSRHDEVTIAVDDTIEIVTAVGGG